MKMELNRDVLRIIAGLSDDRVTLVSKIMRDAYFGKNGIWIKLGIELEEKVSFPLKFYNYSININILPESSGHWVNLSKTIQKSLSRIYSDELDMLIEHIYKNTRYVLNVCAANLDLFSGPIKLHRAREYISDEAIDTLGSGKFSGCLLVICDDFSGDLGSMLERVKNIDYNIELVKPLSTFKEENIKKILAKLKYLDNTSFRVETVYPQVSRMYLYNFPDVNFILDHFDARNFPKLRKITMPNDIFDLVSEKFRGTSVKIKVDGVLAMEQYRNINRDRLNVQLTFSNFIRELDVELVIKNSIQIEKYGVGYMSVKFLLYKHNDEYITFCRQTANILEFIKYYKDFHLTLHIMYFDIPQILMTILSDDKVYGGQTVRIRGKYIIGSENIVRLINQIWEEKKLYIDIDRIGYAPYVDIEKYRKYRP